ncbi:MAG TPA: cytochrome c-type biogenesis protein CcmH [Thermoleophilaceae bacterium]|nr:cytochrome c-type biogenesis protein CcmH [Thermoleophilaceae bacterium]
MRRLLALLMAAALLALPAAATAADCKPRTTLGDVEDEVMCPVCGTPLALATEAPQANRERAFIQGLVDDCLSKDQIKDRLVAEYGSEVLSTPDDSGFDLAATLVPAGLVLLGGGALAAAALQWRRSRGGWTSYGPLDDDPDETGVREPRRPGPPEPGASERLQDDLDRYGR